MLPTVRPTTSPNNAMTYDVRAVANDFLDQAQEEGQKLDHMKLQKLVYIAHGWHLAITGEPLFRETVEAWPYGPVIPELYHELKHCGRGPVEERLSSGIDFDTFEPVVASVFKGEDADDILRSVDVLRRVWANYGRFNALQLSTLTHQPGTPWDSIAKQHNTTKPRGWPIPDEVIEQHYLQLAAERRKARAG
jgi:uncharacterized phage-associated protein